MKKIYIVFPLVFLVVLSIPAYGVRNPTEPEIFKYKESTKPGKYKNWNWTVNELEIIQSFKISDYSKIIVFPLNTSRVILPPENDNTYEPTKKVLSHINEIFIEGLKETIEDKLIIALLEKENVNNLENLKADVLIIKLQVIEMNPGSRALRFWVGGNIAGRAILETEGEILNANTKATLLKFKHIYKSHDPGFFSYEKILTDIVKKTCETIGEMLFNF